MKISNPYEVPSVSKIPRWQHDCKKCKFLGSIMLNQRYDVYHCPYGALGGTLLARYGNDGPEYSSFDTAVFQSMIMGDFRAEVCGTGEITQDISPWMKAVLVVVLHGLK